MKKLMIAAAAVALTGGVFAADVYDYKASVKYVDFKKVKINKATYNVKTVKSTTLTGYLVTPIQCPCNPAVKVTGIDPSFLIVQNKKSSGAQKYTGVKNPKVLPANLLVKVWAANASKTIEAQGYLFAGVMGQEGGATTPTSVQTGGSAAYDFGDLDAADPTFESQYLYSIWNDMDPGSDLFIETWLTHAGFGKGTTDVTKDAGCRKGSSHECLVSLAGSVVGGAFSCEPNEYEGVGNPLQKELFLCQGWNETLGTTDYLMDVVSGTWSIKGNTKIKTATLTAAEQALKVNLLDAKAEEQLGNLKAAGLKLDKNYNLELVEPKFAARWF